MNIERIIINNNVRDEIMKLDLKLNEKYLAMILLNKINYYWNTINKDTVEQEYISKSLESIQKNIVGKEETTRKIVNAIVTGGLVERGTSYQVGIFSKGFKPLFKTNDRLCTLRAEDYLTQEQIRRLKNRVEKQKDWEIEWHRENIIKNVELEKLYVIQLMIDELGINTLFNPSDLANGWSWEDIETVLLNLELDTQKKLMMRLKILELMEIKKTEIKKGGKGGRHYHCLSNAPKSLKKCMVSKDPNKPFLWQIDIKNSQPFFLLAMLLKKGYQIEERLKAEIIGGTFYETIGRLLGYRYEEVTTNLMIRKEVKETVFRDIFFSTSNMIRNSSSKYQKIKLAYPQFCSAIEEITEKNKDKTLASLLQDIESKEVLPVVKKYKGFGIHDSVLVVATEDTNEVQKIAMDLEQRIFKKYKIKVSTSIELISERLSDNPMMRAVQMMALGIE